MADRVDDLRPSILASVQLCWQSNASSWTTVSLGPLLGSSADFDFLFKFVRTSRVDWPCFVGRMWAADEQPPP